ncbi:hypothetical protein [Cupriavidus metallidurans]|uniref:hypothetical protein n=1 Tax=Cupriavidus metallidurans TaxID=119219 RepID=UPI001CCB27B8|nr:hypothetical protein [Cupriavidus metallidurans]UBM11710.1 hypothetical protein LAI70_15325 [Cupriavidus metallidurans]
MNSIKTTVCAAAKIKVEPVKLQLFTPADGRKPYWIATQTLEVTTHDGHECTFIIHLEDGCSTLMGGDPLVIPPVTAAEGEPA